MIDSITIQLNHGQFKIENLNKFDGRKANTIKKRFSNTSLFPKKFFDEKKRNKIYFPVVNLVEKESDEKTKKYALEIQVSLPKTVYEIGVFEVGEEDFDLIAEKICRYLKELNIKAEAENIKSAIVKRIDFSKIIILPEYLGDARFVIRKLARFDYKLSSDCSLKEFLTKGKGIALKFFDKTQGYVIYDKTGEIIDNAKTLFEFEVVLKIQWQNLKRRIIKFEFSLQRKQSAEAFLRRRLNTKQKEFSFRDVFNEQLAKSILLEKFDEVFNGSTVKLLTLAEMNDNQIFSYLENSGMTRNKIYVLYYMANLTTKFGVSGAWGYQKNKLPSTTYEKYRKQTQEILEKLGYFDKHLPNLIKFLRAEHMKFRLIKPTRNELPKYNP